MQRLITLEEMHAAARQLSRSPGGRQAMARLLELMDGDVLELNLLNQRAFLALLGAAWTGRSETARDIMRATLARGGSRETTRPAKAAAKDDGDVSI